jgi:hypothetical protein
MYVFTYHVVWLTLALTIDSADVVYRAREESSKAIGWIIGKCDNAQTHVTTLCDMMMGNGAVRLTVAALTLTAIVQTNTQVCLSACSFIHAFMQ